MRTIGIYKITSPKGKIYIGKSVNIERRFNWYKRPSDSIIIKSDIENKIHVQPILNSSLKKYGWEAHVFEVIQECEEEHLKYYEVYYIWTFNSYNSPHGMNCTMGGDGSLGYKHTEEAKKKVSKANKGRVAGEEEVARRCVAMKKYYSENPHWSIGVKQSPEQIANRVAKNTGRKHSEESKRQQSESAIRNKSKILLNTQTGIFYMGVKNAAETMGVTRTALHGRLVGNSKKYNPFIYV